MTRLAQPILHRVSGRVRRAANIRKGRSKKVVFIFSFVVIATLATSIIVLPYIFPGEDGIQLDMRFVLQSNSTAHVFSTNCSWSANTIEHDVYGTHIVWPNQYSELLVETEGPFTEAFSENGAVYISWNEIHFFGNDTWALQVDLYVFGAEVRIWVFGDVSSVVGVSAELREYYPLSTHQDLGELGVEGVNISTDVSFFAANNLWAEASSWTYGTPHEYLDVDSNANGLFIGTLVIQDF